MFARGVRNSVGIDFNPKDKSLWFTDNQVDGMGDEHPAGRAQSCRQGRDAFRLPLLRRRQGPDQRVQGPAAPRRGDISASRDGGACGRPRHDVLYRPDVSAEVPRRHLLRATRIVEPYDADWRSRDVHTASRRTVPRTRPRRLPKGGSLRTESTWVGRSTSHSCRTGRSWCRTISQAPSTASPTKAADCRVQVAPGAACPAGQDGEDVASPGCRAADRIGDFAIDGDVGGSRR